MKSQKLDRSLLPLVGRRLWPGAGPSPGGLWIQAVSVGEVEISCTFARELRRARPNLPLVLSASTPAGFALLGKRLGEERLDPAAARPFPLDLPVSVRRFFDAVRPRLLVLVETELWPNVLSEAGRRGVGVLLINARLSERSVRRLRLLRPFFRRPLAAVSRVAARTEADAGRFVEIGVPAGRVTVEGDLKYDRKEAPPPSFGERVARLAGERPVLVAGSLWEEETELLLDLRRRLLGEGLDLFLLLAPRRPDSFDDVARRLAGEGLVVARRSKEGTDPERSDVFLLDTLGELASAYTLGTLALLGGTFVPRGGHNVLEPLAAGLPVLHGPSVATIAATLEACPGATFGAEDAAGLAAETRRLLSDGGARRTAAEAARDLFARNRGATARTVAIALDLLGGR